MWIKEKEGVLCAYGILENGKKVLLHLALGSRESYDSWLSFLYDMTARGLKEPMLVTSDKHKGLRKAVRGVFPHAFKQPCLAHKMRNVLCKLPKKIEKEIKPLIKQVYYASSYKEGLKLGHELIANTAENVKNPRQTLPRACFSAAGFVIVLDVLVSLVTAGNLPVGSIVAAKDYALAEAARTDGVNKQS
jgi:transposase-like protein